MDRRKSVAPRPGGEAAYNRRRTTIRMARPGASMPTSNGSENTAAMTEELERTEQQITLTLQEIDRNFSQANRVISESIIPLLEKYGDESAKMWSRVGFWKDFLESSVDVKLTAFEEDVTANMETLSLQNEVDGESSSAAVESDVDGITTTKELALDPNDNIERPTTNALLEENSTVFQEDTVEKPFNGDLFASTPRRSPMKRTTATKPSGTNINDNMINNNSPLKLTKNPKLPSFEVPQLSSQQSNFAFAAGSESPLVTQTKGGILRHQVVDKNWKVKATPRAKQKQTKKPTFADQISDDDDLDVSFEPPKLLSDIFKVSSNRELSAKTGLNLNDSNSMSDISTPQNFQTKLARYAATPKGRADPYLYDDKDSSIDFMQGISPPKLNFGHSSSNNDFNQTSGNTGAVPSKSMVEQSRESVPRLVRTPAKLAVESILKDVLRKEDNDENVFDDI